MYGTGGSSLAEFGQSRKIVTKAIQWVTYGLLGPKTQTELQQIERPETPTNKGIPGHAPDRTRTCGLLLRRQTLYPPELRRQNTILGGPQPVSPNTYLLRTRDRQGTCP